MHIDRDQINPQPQKQSTIAGLSGVQLLRQDMNKELQNSLSNTRCQAQKKFCKTYS